MSKELIPVAAMFELAGSMGSGKSTTGKIFEALGAKVFDTDKVARELQQPGGPALPPMIEILGAEIIGDDGKLDRKKTGDIMFADPELVGMINEALHPMIWSETLAKVGQLSSDDIAIIEVPVPDLDRAEYLDGIVSVITSVEKALERLTEGERKIDPETARQRIGEQISNDERVAMSDFIITNDGSFADLRADTVRAWEWMQKIAAQ